MTMLADYDLLCNLRKKIPSFFTDTKDDYDQNLLSARTVTKGFDESLYRFLDLINLVNKKPKARILDIGIAHGFYDIVLKKSYGMDVTGIERPESIPFYCRMLHAYEIKVVPTNIIKEPLPFADEYFDTVIFSEVIEHLRGHPLIPLKEIERVLKIGGQLVFTTPNIARFTNIVKLIRSINITEEFKYTPNVSEDRHITDTLMHIREYTKQELVALINRAGMDIEGIFMSRAWDRYNAFNEDLKLTSKVLSLLNAVVTLCIPQYRSFVMIRAVKRRATDAQSKT